MEMDLTLGTHGQSSRCSTRRFYAFSAIAGCDYVLHVASPFPQGAPKDENDLIVPARDGTLRVL